MISCHFYFDINCHTQSSIFKFLMTKSIKKILQNKIISLLMLRVRSFFCVQLFLENEHVEQFVLTQTLIKMKHFFEN